LVHKKEKKKGLGHKQDKRDLPASPGKGGGNPDKGKFNGQLGTLCEKNGGEQKGESLFMGLHGQECPIGKGEGDSNPWVPDPLYQKLAASISG